MVDYISLRQPIEKKLIGEKAFSKMSLYKALLEQQLENTIEYFAFPFLRVNKISTRKSKLATRLQYHYFRNYLSGNLFGHLLWM